MTGVDKGSLNELSIIRANDFIGTQKGRNVMDSPLALNSFAKQSLQEIILELITNYPNGQPASSKSHHDGCMREINVSSWFLVVIIMQIFD